MQSRIYPWLVQKWLVPCLIMSALAGCSSLPKAPTPTTESAARTGTANAGAATARTLPALPAARSGRGGYYLDDGPGDAPPAGLQDVPDAEPKVEPYADRGNKPYVVFGKTYTPLTDNRPFKQRGVGSWYGKKFHGQKTSSGEPYDMYKMTAAHPTLPIPSYARVTNLATGVQIIVRVNDRGPFHSSRIIDLSYTAALKLGYLSKGSSQLEVERLLPDDIARINSGKQSALSVARTASPMPEPISVTTTAEPPAAVVELMRVTAADVSVSAIAPQSTAPSPVEFVPAMVSTQSMENAAATAATTTSAAPDPARANGYYIQFGAYAQAGNAEVVRTRIAQNWASKLPPLEVVQNGSIHRLYCGPFATRSDAMSAAQLVQDVAAKPMIVQR